MSTRTCPSEYETATGVFDPAGYDPKDCAGCGRPLSEHEPIFVLRAQDASADYYVEAWADRAALRLGKDHPKVVEARECAALMRAWPTRKHPD